MKLNMRSLPRRILIMAVCAIVVTASYFEFRHRYNYGHFVPYGLHVDVRGEDRSIGIPGQTKMYVAELSNFTFLPARFEACNYISDDFSRGTDYAYAVQRWNDNSGSWQTIAELNGEGFCRPVPLSIIKADLVSRRLWPGMRVEAMGGEATGARDAFRKDDRARFVIFKNSGDWQGAVASEPFIIVDDVVRNEHSRVKH